MPELKEPSVRELLVGNYRLIYEIRQEAIYVLGVIHGARQLGRLWSRETRPGKKDGRKLGWEEGIAEGRLEERLGHE